MAICYFCNREMTTSDSCTATALNHGARQVALWPYGKGPGDRLGGPRCVDCGVKRGGYHHPGCDLQRCPICRRQMVSCDCLYEDDYDDDEDDAYDNTWRYPEPPREPWGVDAAGNPTERLMLGDQAIILHHGDVPESDCTVFKGIPCTTALRTLIDCAPDMTQVQLQDTLHDFLERELFTVPQAWQRICEPDMAKHPGAALLGKVLPPYAADR